MIFHTEKCNNAYLINYKVIKSRIVVRSLLNSANFSLTDACGTAITIKHDLELMLGKILEITILTVSATLLNLIIQKASTIGKRLMIYIKSAREAYSYKISNVIFWIRQIMNLADAMKEKKC